MVNNMRSFALSDGRVCPTPTPQTLYDDIAGEIERGIKAGAPPDTLATEWERLNNGAQICGEGR
jgi:hypothetical protein